MHAPNAQLSDKAEYAARVLVVDDDELVQRALSKFLRLRGYDGDVATSGAAALDALRSDRYDLALVDVQMPGISGLELVPHALGIDPTLAIVMLTSVTDAAAVAQALKAGAIDYLTKPVDPSDLASALKRALKERQRRLQERESEERTRMEMAEQGVALEEGKRAQRDLAVGIAETLINVMEAKDSYFRGHSQRVAELSATIAAELGLDDAAVEEVRLAGTLHDIGKIAIPESILNKPGDLTAEERAQVQQYVEVGIRILTPLRHLGAALQYIRDHHERVDGTGYPRGLSGDAISIGGKILAAADSFDALTSGRTYQRAISREAALAYLRDLVGRSLDGKVYDALCRVIRSGKSLVFIDATA